MHDAGLSLQHAKPLRLPTEITSSTISNVIWSAGLIASRFPMAAYRWRISCNTSASVTRRCPAAISRSRMTCASVLCGWAAPIKYIGMLESTKINPGTRARFRSASAQGQQSGTRTWRHAGSPSISFRGQSPAGSPARHRVLAGPTHPPSTFTLGQALEVRHFGNGKQHLEALTHRMSIASSSMECPVRAV